MKLAKQLFSILLIPATLWAGMGFSVSQHYCLGMLKSESFYGQAKDCGMHASITCERKQAAIDFDCCEDENLIVQAVSFERLHETPSFVKTFAALWPAITDVWHKATLEKATHRWLAKIKEPPPLNLILRYQQFLI